MFLCGASVDVSTWFVLQERSGNNSFTHEAMSLKYKLDNEFELIFVVSSSPTARKLNDTCPTPQPSRCFLNICDLCVCETHVAPLSSLSRWVFKRS